MKSLTTVTAPAATRPTVADTVAGFTNMQWFLYSARNTIYYSAFLAVPIDRARALDIARHLVELAPQLKTGFVGARPAEPLTEEQMDAVTSYELVDSLEAYPNAWLQSGEEVYDTHGLPLFRFKAVVRKAGTDDKGRGSMLLVVASHALMEGSDSAMLARSQDTSHTASAGPQNPLAPLERLRVNLLAGLMLVGHLLAGHLAAPPKMKMVFDAQVYVRHDIRTIANRLGVSQRAVMYAAVMYALNHARKRRVSALYTILGGDRRDADDDFIRARALNVHFPLAGRSLESFIQVVHTTMLRQEARREGFDQYVFNTLYGLHRRVGKFLPFLYTRRFFRFPGLYDIVLTMTPPHRIVGSLMEDVIEPIYAGSYHQGVSLVTFVPARKHLTINYTLPPALADRGRRVPGLIAQLAAGPASPD